MSCGGQRLAVGPHHALTDVEGPGQAVLAGLPRLSQPRLRGHVLHRVADHVVVGQRPHLVGLRLDPEERVERVDLVEDRHGERGGVLLGRVRGGRCQGGDHHRRGRQCQCGDQPGGATVPCMTPQPPRAARRAYEHTEHGVRRPDPFHWLRELDSPDVLAHLAAERAWYDSATGHLDSLVAVLRTEMQARVPATDRSVSWRRAKSSYYTVLAEGREHPQLFRDRHLPVTQDSVHRAAPGREPPRHRLRVRRARPDQHQPGRRVAGLVGRRGRRRGLHAAVPRPGLGRGPRRGGAAQLLRRRVEPGLAALLLHGPRRGVPAPPGPAAHAGHPGQRTTCSSSRSPTSGTSCRVRAPRSGGPLVLWAESRDTREVWVLDGDDPAARPRSVGGRRRGRGVPRRAPAPPRRLRAPARRHQRRGRRVPARRRAGAVRRRPGPHGVVADPAGGPRRAARAGRRVRLPRGAGAAAGWAAGPAPAADRGPRRRRGRPHARVPDRDPGARAATRSTTPTS